MLAFDNQEHQRKRRPPEDIRLLLPRLAGRPVANPTPQVTDFLPVTVHAACGPQFSSAGEVLNEASRTASKPLLTYPRIPLCRAFAMDMTFQVICVCLHHAFCKLNGPSWPGAVDT